MTWVIWMGSMSGKFCVATIKIERTNSMKRFNLEEYLKNPSKKVVTRMGRKVRIICTDREDSIYPIIALIKDDKRESEILVTYTKDGIPDEYNEVYYTLFFAPEKKSGWINLYKMNSIISPGPRAYDTKEEAESAAGDKSYYISTIKIEWEE